MNTQVSNVQQTDCAKAQRERSIASKYLDPFYIWSNEFRTGCKQKRVIKGSITHGLGNDISFPPYLSGIDIVGAVRYLKYIVISEPKSRMFVSHLLA